LRPAWLRIIGHEVAAARQAGVAIEGICLYPILDYPGWEDERHCPTGLFGYALPNGTRPLDEPLASELVRQQTQAGGVSPRTLLATPIPAGPAPRSWGRGRY